MKFFTSILCAVCLAGSSAVWGQSEKSGEESSANRIERIGGRKLEEWKRDLTHSDPTIREDAIVAISLFGDDCNDRVITKLIMDRCTDRDHSLRTRAVIALATIHIDKEDLPRVIDLLVTLMTRDAQVVVRYQAAIALSRYGEEAASRIQQIIQAANDPSWRVRQAALMVLATAGRPEQKAPPNPMAVQGMLDALRDPAVHVRVEAIKGLGWLGKPADPTLLKTVDNALRLQTSNSNKIVVIYAWVSLMAITETNQEEVVKGIASLLKHEESRIKIAAATALALLRERSKFAMGDLIELLNDQDVKVVVAGILAIGSIEKPGLSARMAVEKVYNNKESTDEVKKVAKFVLDKIDGKEPDNPAPR